MHLFISNILYFSIMQSIYCILELFHKLQTVKYDFGVKYDPDVYVYLDIDISNVGGNTLQVTRVT